MDQAVPSSHSPNSRSTGGSSGPLVVAAVAIVLLIALHGWLTLRLFPNWTALVNDEPVISVDHAIHIYHGYLGAKFLREHGTSWGYDPFFMAGYPKTPVYDSSSGPSELFQLLGGGYSPRAYKIGIVLLVALLPVLISLAASSYARRPAVAVAAMAWSIWYVWAGAPDVLIRTGLVAFVWSSALSVCVPAMLVRWGERPSLANGVGLWIAAAAGLQSHGTFPLMAFVPLWIGYVGLSAGRSWGGGTARVHGWRWHAVTWGILMGALALTSFWWWPLVQFIHLKTSSDLFMTHRGSAADLMLAFVLVEDGRLQFLMMLLGAIGLVRWFVAGARCPAAMLTGQLIVFGGLTFFGSMWSVTRNLEPLRFQVPLGFAWSVAAGEGVVLLVTVLDPRRAFGPRRSVVGFVLGMLGAACVVLVTVPKLWWWSTGLRQDRTPPSTWWHSRMRVANARPLAVGLRPEMEELVDWIKRNTDDSARILFEDQLRLLEHMDPGAAESLHWTPLLPLATGRQFVGGLYHLAFIPHRRASFGDWSLGDRKIRDWSSDELRFFCEQYNIGWVVTWSRASWLKSGEDRGRALGTDVFAGLPFCERVGTLPRHTSRPDENLYTVFRVDREASYFARGRGRLAAVEPNRIEFADVEPEGGEVVLRFHWQAELRTDPPCVLERVDTPGDPVGFIRVRAAGRMDRLVLENGY